MDFKITKSDIYLFLLFFGFAIPVGLVDYADYDRLMDLFWETILYVVFTSMSTYLIVYVFFAKFFPRKQFLFLLLSTTLLLIVLGIAWINALCYFVSCKGDPMSLNYIYYGFVSQVDNVGIIAAILLGKKLFDTQVHIAKVEKEKKESELRFLKSQIDPHFLFNNLNTVDSLIDKDPKAAKLYLNKLAALYRYLISSKDHEVVTLEEELEFARNYMYLIESRFGDAYQFEIINELDEEFPMLIPPGALQTLLENIVKHNQANSNTPIRSQIRISDKGIEVSNDLKPKNQKVDSTGTGLVNLKTRYKLLTDKDIQIIKDQLFTVKLPMIKLVR